MKSQENLMCLHVTCPAESLDGEVDVNQLHLSALRHYNLTKIQQKPLLSLCRTFAES